MKRYVLVDGVVRTIKDGVETETAIANLRAKGRTVMKCKKPPTIGTMSKWMADGIARATDGCRVEPDGECPHGCKSWLLVLGYI